MLAELEAAPSIDVDRLRAVLEHITENRAGFRQGTWGVRSPKCGTVHCIAGWTVALEPTYELNWQRDRPGYYWLEYVAKKNEPGALHVRFVAQELLGLTREQANILFDAYNSLFRLWGYASHWTGGAIQRPESVSPRGFCPS